MNGASAAAGGGGGALARAVGPGASAGGGGGSSGGGAGTGGGDGRSAIGSGGDGAGEYGAYLAALRRRVQEALDYPLAARRRGLVGTVQLEITILPSGVIGPVTVARSCSHPLLDEAAIATVRSLRPAPFPRELPPRTLTVRLPVVFELR